MRIFGRDSPNGAQKNRKKERSSVMRYNMKAKQKGQGAAKRDGSTV